MKKIILLLICLTTFSIATAQKEADKWFFGNYVGLDFSTGTPLSINGSAIYTIEGCASICDASGNLLFYTDGSTIWNKLNQPMPNGTGLLAGSSCTQAALIVPQPGSDTLYYVFTNDEYGGPNGFRYSIVDMSLQGGSGDVTTTKNVLIQNTVTEKLTAVKQLGSNDYWVAVHAWGSDEFDVYGLTAAGLQTNPVVSNTGIVHTMAQIQNTYGQMKFNPCGTKLALAAGYLNTVEIFDFNPLTGVVSNPITLALPQHVYGLEFSTNGNMVYVTSYDSVQAAFLQFDISSGNPSTIMASQTVISTTQDLYALQLGPDRKIYVARSFNSYIGAIDFPNLAGTACNYVDMAVDVDPNFMGNLSALGMPGFVQSLFRFETLCSVSGIEDNNQQQLTTIYPNPSNTDFTVRSAKEISTLHITDETGRTVALYQNIDAVNSLRFGNQLMPGVYMVFITDEDGNNIVMKAIKSN
ncbi:MAG: T9SS type A sorting domain-containing protein [Bacteroidia bacterium]